MEVDSDTQEINKEKYDSSKSIESTTQEVQTAVTAQTIDDQNTPVQLAENSDNEKVNKSEENKETTNLTDTFKKPILIIGPRKGAPTKLKTISQSFVAEDSLTSEAELKSDSKKELLNPAKISEKSEIPIETQKDINLPLPYIEPPWSGKPDEIYKLEVLKSGVILETIDLSDKNYFVVGRLPVCDISMAHPTISRYHAIFQYRSKDDEKNGKGFYVYDLGSTHGTFWNGNRIRSKVYVRLQGGHMIKFGCSQRKFIVVAPPDDQEEESEYSVTQLKEIRKQELEERERLEKQRLLEEEEEERLRKEKEESEGIDWGMGEDADEESDLTENPFAQTNNEELFLDDPKKTLRGWFEREGYDLQYQTEDKGIGKFLCWVDLPIDTSIGRTVRAEALVTGKKKEAVIQCALEACRILDRYGLLRQANHEARKRKTRNWEEEDYYDSDEDNFLDRTGTVEKKREQRMKMAGKLEAKAETYDSLLEKHAKVTNKISEIENRIALQKMKQSKMDESNEDALDVFMSSLDTSTLDKTEIRKMKIELINLRKEEMQLLKLINIAKPANLPPLKPHVPSTIKKSKDDFKNLKLVVGHKKNLKPSDQNLNENTINQDLIDNSNDRLKELQEEKQEQIDDDNGLLKTKLLNFNDESKDSTLTTEIVNRNENETGKDNETSENADLKKKRKNMKRNKQRSEKSQNLQKDYDEDEFREDYSTWIPPENQTGDGKTKLNEKFGY